MMAGHSIEVFFVWPLEVDSLGEEREQVLLSRERLSQVEELLKFRPTGPLKNELRSILECDAEINI